MRKIAVLWLLWAFPLAAIPIKELPAQAREALEHLASFKAIEARFEQLDPREGFVHQGKMVIARPGKARFDYYNPNMQLIINKGKVTFYDAELEQVSYADINDTLLAFLLEQGDDFYRAFTVIDAEEGENETSLLIQPVEVLEEGVSYELALIFTRNPTRLARIHRMDADGRVTIISLQNVLLNGQYKDALFRFVDPKKNELDPRQ